MLPTLRPGDVVLTVADHAPPTGSVVVLPMPERPGRWLVKRVGAAEGGEAWVVSDNLDATFADSRRFGWIPTTGMRRVVMRWRPPLGLSRVRARAT